MNPQAHWAEENHMNNIASLFVEALKNTPVGYFESVLSQRNPGPAAMGSIFDVEQDYHSLLDVAEKAEEYDAGSTGMPICKYVKLPIPGTVGVVDLDKLPADAQLVLLDPKNTIGSVGGGVDAYYEVTERTGEHRVDFTVAIVGPGDAKDENDVQKPVLWTIHPGHTAPRPKAVDNPELVGKVVTPAEAKALGLTIAKIVVSK